MTCDLSSAFRKPRIDCLIRVPPRALKSGHCNDVVIERPEGVVRKSLVIVFYLFRGEWHGNQPHTAGVEWLQFKVSAPRPSHPRTRMLAHDWFKSCDEPTGRLGPRLVPVRIQDTIDGKAIGNDNEVEKTLVCHGFLSHLFALLLLNGHVISRN